MSPWVGWRPDIVTTAMGSTHLWNGQARCIKLVAGRGEFCIKRETT